MLAVIRPNDWDIPLLVHVLGAMLLVGSLTLVITSLAGAWRGGTLEQVRLGYRALLIATLPSWIVMRVAAEWIASKEKLEDAKLTWLDIGYSTAEPGLLLLIIATVTTGLAVRRARQAEGPEQPVTVRVATVLVGILLIAYIIAIWAMTTKPD